MSLMMSNFMPVTFCLFPSMLIIQYVPHMVTEDMVETELNLQNRWPEKSMAATPK